MTTPEPTPTPEQSASRSPDSSPPLSSPAPSNRATPTLPPDLFRDAATLVAEYEALQGSRVGLVISVGETSGISDLVLVHADSLFPSASLYKLFVLWAVQVEIHAGRLTDTTALVLTPETDDSVEDGYRLGNYGDTITVAEARRLMIAESNNTAAWLLVEAVGGWAAVERPLRANQFALTETSPDLLTTPREVARFFEGVVTHNLDPVLTLADYELMLDLLRDRSASAYLLSGFPNGTTFAHKTGNLEGVLHDAGALQLRDGRTIYLVVLTEGDYEASRTFMAEIARLVWQVLGDGGNSGP